MYVMLLELFVCLVIDDDFVIVFIMFIGLEDFFLDFLEDLFIIDFIGLNMLDLLFVLFLLVLLLI